jgi:hypothetical protein
MDESNATAGRRPALVWCAKLRSVHDEPTIRPRRVRSWFDLAGAP